MPQPSDPCFDWICSFMRLADGPIWYVSDLLRTYIYSIPQDTAITQRTLKPADPYAVQVANCVPPNSIIRVNTPRCERLHSYLFKKVLTKRNSIRYT